MVTVNVVTKCPRCGKTETLRVNRKGLEAWQGGMLIQNAFPSMTSDDRERLITGTCPTCWDAMFGGE